MGYSQEQLLKTTTFIVNTIQRCEKMVPKFKEGSSQYSLLKNRIHALKVSKDLIENQAFYTDEEIQQSLAPINSIIHKTSKARSKYEINSTTYKRFTPTIDAMEIAKYYILEEMRKRKLDEK